MSSPYLRAALIIIACVCFGVALTYPILYAFETEDSSSGMDSLAAMRQQALDSSTQEPESPVPVANAPVDDSEMNEKLEGDESVSIFESAESVEVVQEDPEKLNESEQEKAALMQIESGVQNVSQDDQDTQQNSTETYTVVESMKPVDEKQVITSKNVNLSISQDVSFAPENDEDGIRRNSPVSYEAEELAENTRELSGWELAVSDVEIDTQTVESVSDNMPVSSLLSWTDSSRKEEEGQVITSRGSIELELAEMLEIITDDGQIVSAMNDLNNGTLISDKDESDVNGSRQPVDGGYLNLSEMEKELSEEMMILTEEGELIPALKYDPNEAERKKQEMENSLIAEMMVMTDMRLMSATELMIQTPTPRPVIRITPSPVPTTTPDRRIRTDTVVAYPNKEKVLLDENKILDELKDIYEINNDLVGWLNIPGTYIDYPVVQSAEKDPDYYLKHDFYGKYNKNGQLILDPKCDPYTPSYNLIISGHHMLNGNMFGYLSRFYKKEYWEKRKILKFDSLMERKEYVIFATFYSADYDIDEEGFRYNADIRFRRECEAWLAEIRENQLYDTGIDAEFGDEFITLTTCAANRKNGRFVAVARRIREGESFE